MYKLIRRISSSVFPRPDRPWSDDATSNAPTIGRKRRISSTDMDVEDVPVASESLSKKPRTSKSSVDDDDEDPATCVSTQSSIGSSPPVEEVREVTAGVKTIDLESEDVASSSESPVKSTAPLDSNEDPISVPDLPKADDKKDEEKPQIPLAEAKDDKPTEVISKAVGEGSAEVKSQEEASPTKEIVKKAKPSSRRRKAVTTTVASKVDKEDQADKDKLQKADGEEKHI